jgi:hypothetical protein
VDTALEELVTKTASGRDPTALIAPVIGLRAVALRLWDAVATTSGAEDARARSRRAGIRLMHTQTVQNLAHALTGKAVVVADLLERGAGIGLGVLGHLAVAPGAAVLPLTRTK